MITQDSDFDDLIAEYINRFSTLAGNSTVLVESFYKKVDKDISKRFEFEAKLLQRIDKYRFKAVKKAIKAEYGWWARLKRWLHGKPKGACTDASCPPLAEEEKAPDTQTLLNQIATLTQQLNLLEQKRTAQELPLNVETLSTIKLEQSASIPYYTTENQE